MNKKLFRYVQGCRADAIVFKARYLAVVLATVLLPACTAAPSPESSSAPAAVSSSSVDVVSSTPAVTSSSVAVASSAPAAMDPVDCSVVDVAAGKAGFTGSNCSACHGAFNEATGTAPGSSIFPAVNSNSFVKFNEAAISLDVYIAENMMNSGGGCADGDAACEATAANIATYIKSFSDQPWCTQQSNSSVAMSSSSAPVVASSSSAAVTTEQFVVAINVGGAKTQLNNVEYGADRFFTGGTANTTQAAIAGVTEDTLYQSERYGIQEYEVPVTQGTYNITLHFNENYATAAGARAFNVSVEGQNRLASLDIFSLVGGNTAYSVDVDSIPVSDGNLSIALDAVIFNPTLSGFAIYSTDGGKYMEPPEPEPVPTPVPGDSEPSIGCGQNPGQKGSQGSPLNIGNGNKYYVTTPNNYNKDKPYPVIFVHHPSGGSGIGWGAGKFSSEATSNSIMVYPQSRNIQGGWGASDFQMFEPLYNKITGDFCVNKAAVFAMGYSSGGDYSGMIACEHGDKVTGIAPVNPKHVGGYDVRNPSARSCKGNVKAIIIYGNNDTVLGNSASGRQMTEFYRVKNSCSTATVAYPGRPECKTYQGCKEGAEVSFCSHNYGYGGNGSSNGAGHGYPGWTGGMFWDVIKNY